MTRKVSGTSRSPWGLLTHVGRRSGRTYQTSLGTYDYGDGFLLPLGYGTHTDWYQNLMAAGTCELAWKGHIHHLVVCLRFDVVGVCCQRCPRDRR